MKIFILFMVLVSHSIGVYSQHPSLFFKSLSTNNGLSNNWVRCFYQDGTGFMWFGTADGLNRYDGYDFKVFRPADADNSSLGDIHINAITAKNDHELWICTDMGIYTFDFLLQDGLKDIMLDRISVLTLVEDNQKNVWFGTNKGLYKYNPADSSMSLYLADVDKSSGLSSNYINVLFQDSESNLWIGTKNGLYLFNKKTGTMITPPYSPINQSLKGTDVISICEDVHQRLWIATSQNGLHLLVRKTETQIQLKKVLEGVVTSLLTDDQNNLWIGRGTGEGLLKLNIRDFDPGKKVAVIKYQHDPSDNNTLSDNSIFCLYQDNLKDLWIGTTDGGANFCSMREKKFNIVNKKLPGGNTVKSDLINVFFEEDEYLWIGTEGGLDRLDKETSEYIHFQYDSQDPTSIGGNPIFAIQKDSRGNLWVGTWSGGLNQFNYQTTTFKRFLTDGSIHSISSNNILSVVEDSRKNLWIGTQGGGLNRYNYKDGTFTRFVHDENNPGTLFHSSVNKILETSKGKLYISTYFSLDLFDYEKESFTHFIYGNSNSSTGSKIISIYEDSKKNIWIATNKGLELFDEKKGLFMPYFSDSSLSNNVVQGLLEDDHGNLWVSTNNGIYKVIQGVERPSDPVFQKFTSIDGLSDDEFTKRATFRSKTGIMYFGSSKGFTYFHPDSILFNTVLPKVVLTEFMLLYTQPNDNNKFKSIPENINVVEKLDLSYRNTDFVIRFAALNYLHTDKNHYQYKLEGYDKSWIDAGTERTATYTNIQPGKYVFLVKGSNNDGIWCANPKSLAIIIHPPWWGTLLFKIALGLIAVMLGLAFHIGRLSFLKRQNYFLEHKVIKRTNDISEMNAVLEEKQEEILAQNNELEYHRNNLEKLVKERTKELVSAKIKAEESDRLKSSFLANMSHEIRTPMNAIYGFASLLKDVPIDEVEKKQYLDIISNNCEALLVLFDDLLDMSMIEANNLKITRSDFEVNGVLKDMERQLQLKNHKNIEIEFDNKQKDSLVLYNDLTRFRQVFNNLLNNAYKYTESGKIKFGYLVLADVVRFYVSDTGIGIDDSHIRKVFDQFYKVESDTKKQYRGTGIGLTISKKLVDLMEGKIWVESALNNGSVFYFELRNTQENNLTMKTEIADQVKLSWLKGTTILIAEDDPTNYRLLTAMLKSSGGKIQWAQDGQEAINYIKNKPKDEKCIVLMDIKMPVINGYEATRQIKKIDNKIFVIAVTAYAQPTDRDKIMSSQFDGYIAKPFNLETLLNTMSKFSSSKD